MALFRTEFVVERMIFGGSRWGGGGVPYSPSCGVCVLRFVRFTRLHSGDGGLGGGGLFLTVKLLKHGKQGYRYHTRRRVFFEFYHRH